jgi:hypothetical protein
MGRHLQHAAAAPSRLPSPSLLSAFRHHRLFSAPARPPTYISAPVRPAPPRFRHPALPRPPLLERPIVASPRGVCRTHTPQCLPSMRGGLPKTKGPPPINVSHQSRLPGSHCVFHMTQILVKTSRCVRSHEDLTRPPKETICPEHSLT